MWQEEKEEDTASNISDDESGLRKTNHYIYKSSAKCLRDDAGLQGADVGVGGLGDGQHGAGIL